MAKYTVKFSCGHEGTVRLFGRSSERERKLKWLETQLCWDCQKAEQEKKYKEEAEKGKEFAEEMGLPELTGTEKQISWALAIREKKLIGAESYKEYNNFDIFYDWLANHKEAIFWIDHQNDSTQMLARVFRTEKKNKEKSARMDEVEDLELVRPKEQKTNVIATIEPGADRIKVVSDKNIIIIDTVRDAGFKWNELWWQFPISERTGTADDRMIEIGNKLLNAGVPIKIKKELIDKAVNGDYKPYTTKWIDSDGLRIIIYWGSDFNYCDEALVIPSAYYKSRVGVIVKQDYFEEIREFAKLYNFKITTIADELLRKVEEKIKGAKIVIPKSREIVDDKPNLKDIMDSSRDVLDDLRDE